MPVEPQLSAKRWLVTCIRKKWAIHGPRSLVLAEIHADPVLTFVPEPSASEINGGVADI